MTTPVAVVTGAAGALGSAVARTLVERGWKLALVDVAAGGAEGALAKLAAELRGAIAIAGDARDAAFWRDAIARIARELGAAPTGAALVAGAWRGGAPLHEEDAATWRAMIDTNLDTAHASLRALLPEMVREGRGSVVVVGSRAVDRPWTSGGAAAYAASKAAVVTLAQAAAAEVLDRGVRINAVLPSTIDTPANRRAMPDADPRAWVSTSSLAAVIAFLLSEDARDVSGAALPVYGRA